MLQKSIVLKIVFLTLLLVSMAVSLSLFVQNFSLTSSYEHTIAEKTTEIENLKEDMLGLETKLNQQQEFLDSRQGFLDTIAKAKAALVQAEVVTDVSESLKIIQESQETVYQERANPANIIIQTEKVKKETGEILARIGFMKTNNNPTSQQTITAADLMQDVEGLRTLPSNHPAKQALDAIGGADIMLGAAPIVCNQENSMACAYPTGVILLAEKHTEENYEFYYPVMMHEYAHQIQYKYLDELNDSLGYKALFNKDMEWLADCMAAAKIPGYFSNYQYECSSAQKEYGTDVWKGVFS